MNFEIGGYGVIYFIFAAGVFILVLAMWILKNRRRMKLIKDQVNHEQISLNVSTGSEEINVAGSTVEYVITVDNRHHFLVKDGMIVAYKDSTRSNEFKKYSEAG